MKRTRHMHNWTPSPLQYLPSDKPRTLLQIASHNLIHEQLKNIQNNIIFLDIETDGLPPKCEILSICMTNINANPSTNLQEQFYYLKPSQDYKINYQSQAYKINRITQKEIDNHSMTLTNIGDQIIQLLTNNITVGFNINTFDIPILRKSLLKRNKILPPIPTIDLYKLHHKAFKHDLSSSLESLNCYPIPEHLKHSATADTEACIRLMAALMKKLKLPKSINEYENLDSNMYKERIITMV
jgi:DNA polymerase III epsilon subunit-like protein